MTTPAEPYAVHHKRWSTTPLRTGGLPTPGTGALLGKQHEPRELAWILYDAGWTDALENTIMLCVALAESQGFDHAIHVNLDGTVDLGWLQLNSVHGYTEADCYDVEKAAALAYKLYVAAGRQASDWAAWLTGVYLHDSYVGRAVRGVGNMLGQVMLDQPVPDWDGQPYRHRYTSPMLNMQFRLEGVLAGVESARRELGWQPATKAVIDKAQTSLAAAQTAARATLPPAQP